MRGRRCGTSSAFAIKNSPCARAAHTGEFDNTREADASHLQADPATAGTCQSRKPKWSLVRDGAGLVVRVQQPWPVNPVHISFANWLGNTGLPTSEDGGGEVTSAVGILAKSHHELCKGAFLAIERQEMLSAFHDHGHTFQTR